MFCHTYCSHARRARCHYQGIQRGSANRGTRVQADLGFESSAKVVIRRQTTGFSFSKKHITSAFERRNQTSKSPNSVQSQLLVNRSKNQQFNFSFPPQRSLMHYFCFVRRFFQAPIAVCPFQQGAHPEFQLWRFHQLGKLLAALEAKGFRVVLGTVVWGFHRLGDRAFLGCLGKPERKTIKSDGSLCL